MEKNDERKSNSPAKQSWIDGAANIQNPMFGINNHDEELQAIKEQYRKSECDLDPNEKSAIDLSFRLVEAAKKQSENQLCFEDIKTLGVDANSEIRSLSFYRDVDLPLPYDIPATSSGVGVFADTQAMKKTCENSIAWIREILKPQNRKLRDNKGKILKDANLITREQKAMCVLYNHPEWTNKKIAEEIGVHRSMLYRWNSFMDARAGIKEEGKRGLCKGYKTQDGDIEAYK